MGSNSVGDAAPFTASYERQSFQLSYSELQYQSRQRASFTQAGPPARGEADVFLSSDAQNALENARLAVTLGKAANKQDIADRTSHGMSDFVHRLHELLGAQDDAEARGRFSGQIGALVAERAQQMGRGLAQEAGTAFSFTELQVEVSIESFDLRVQTDEGETTLQIERISLSLSVTHMSASLNTRESLAIGAGPVSSPTDQDDAALSGHMEAITQLFDRMMGIGSIHRPGPANLLRISTDILLVGQGVDSAGTLMEPDRTDLTA